MVNKTISLKTSLATKIANDMRIKIVLGVLKEGTLLNETLLAEEYGVSRGPIRQAVQILSAEGILEPQQNGRTKILGFRPNELQDYFSLRLYIESESIKKILLQPADDRYWKWLDELESTLESPPSVYSNIISADNYFNEQDTNFHYAIVSHADSQLYIQIWKTLSNLASSISELHKLYYSEKFIRETDITIASHKRLITGLRNRDLDAVLNELSEHMQHGVTVLSYTWQKAREEVNSHIV